MLKFGRTSLKRLESCHPDLQKILHKALTTQVVDISVVCGHRDEATQNSLYPTYTSVKFPNSKHNSYPSNAVDIAPYHPVYKYLSGHPSQLKLIAKNEFENLPEEVGIALAKGFIQFEYGKMLGVVQACANELGIGLRCGYDWDGDRNSFDHTFVDMPHIELK